MRPQRGRQGDLSCQRLNPAGQPRPIHLLRSTMAFVLGRRRERPVRTFDLPACVGSDLSDLVHARPQLTAGQRKHTTQGEPPIANGAHEMKADRKSTRLNSSHVKISYAVFCLKKKMTELPRWLS